MTENNQILTQIIAGHNTNPTTTALVLPDCLTEKEWAEMGARLWHSGESLLWWLADWAAFGNRKWGALKAFCEANPRIDYGRLRNLASVAGSVHLSLRSDKLTFAH